MTTTTADRLARAARSATATGPIPLREPTRSGGARRSSERPPAEGPSGDLDRPEAALQPWVALWSRPGRRGHQPGAPRPNPAEAGTPVTNRPVVPTTAPEQTRTGSSKRAAAGADATARPGLRPPHGRSRSHLGDPNFRPARTVGWRRATRPPPASSARPPRPCVLEDRGADSPSARELGPLRTRRAGTPGPRRSAGKRGGGAGGTRTRPRRPRMRHERSCRNAA